MRKLFGFILVWIVTGCGQEHENAISRYKIERVPKLNSVGSGLQHYKVQTTSRFVNHFYSVSDGANEAAIFEIKTTKDLAQVVKYIPIKVDAKLDLEGIALAKDGSLWLANEEGPSLINFDPLGKNIKSILIAGKQLPRILRSMQSGRGFEGVATYEDKLFAVMQSSLNIEGRTPEALFLRLISYNLRNDTLKTYAYPLDDFSEKRRNQVQITDITALDEERLLVTELSPSGTQKIMLVSLNEATNITDKMAGEEELEFVTDRNILFGKPLSKNSGLIIPLEKKALIDVTDLGWNGGVIEGLTVIPDSRKIAISSAGTDEAVLWIFNMPQDLAPKNNMWIYIILLAVLTFAYSKIRE